ncbi:hypothetical protein AMTRI_Chr11g157220 [Amborella trichopoda]
MIKFCCCWTSFLAIFMEQEPDDSMVSSEQERHTEEEMVSLSSILPDELVTKILISLPVKSICRFKVVSRPWQSLLSSSHFAITFSLSNTRSLFLQNNQMFFASAENINNPSSYTKTAFQHQDLTSMACHNGIACCLVKSIIQDGYFRRDSFFTVGNPLAQKQFMGLPRLAFGVQKIFGFYFNPIDKKFKILVGTRKNCSCLIFDSSIGRWRRPRNQPNFRIHTPWFMVSVGFTCYVLCNGENERHLLALDMETEEWEIILTPTGLNDKDCSYRIHERDSCLCLIQVGPHSQEQAHAWLLTEGKKWVEVMNADLTSLLFKKLGRLGVYDFFASANLFIGDILLMHIQNRRPVNFLSNTSVGITYNTNNARLSEVIEDPNMSCVFLNRSSLFTAEKKNGEIHIG